MTDDIVEELLERFGSPVGDCEQGPNCMTCKDQKIVASAAAEIERLRAKIEQYKELTCWPAMDDGTCSCCDERRALEETP